MNRILLLWTFVSLAEFFKTVTPILSGIVLILSGIYTLIQIIRALQNGKKI